MKEYCQCENPSINKDDCSGNYNNCYICDKRDKNCKPNYDINWCFVPEGLNNKLQDFMPYIQLHTPIQTNILPFIKLDENATEPKRNNDTDAGIDLFALEDVVVPSIPKMLWKYIKSLVFSHSFYAIKDKAESKEIEEDNIFATKIKTGIAFEISHEQYGQILDRSGMGSKLLKTLGGVIDSTYRGDVTVMMMNLSFKDYQIKKGDKIAQMVILPVNLTRPVKVNALTDTVRGVNGFGSSGR
jgi:dUTP pyrophosphatase